MKIMDDFHLELKPSCTYHKIDTFQGSKDKWDTKEDPGKSMNNVIYVQWYDERHLSVRLK